MVNWIHIPRPFYVSFSIFFEFVIRRIVFLINQKKILTFEKKQTNSGSNINKQIIILKNP